MAAAIQETDGFEVELIEGGGGIFDVVANGELIYSKHETGHFPENEEIVSLLKNAT